MEEIAALTKTTKKIFFGDNHKPIDPRDKKAVIVGLIKGLNITLLTSSVFQDKFHVERAWRNGNSGFPLILLNKTTKN